MTRAEMVVMLRRRIGDIASTRWTTDTALDQELLAAARYFAMDVGLRAIFPRGQTATQTLTVVSGTTAYQLNSNFLLLRKARWTDAEAGTIWCRELEADEIEQFEEAQAAFDGEGRPVFYLDSDTTDVLTFNFPYDPARAMTIVVTYQKQISDVAGDSSTFAIPDPLHELVVYRAGLQLLGSDEAGYGQLQSAYNDTYAQARGFLRKTKRLRRVAQRDGIVS